MSQADDIVGSGGLHCVDGGLNGVVQGLAVYAAGDAVDVVAVAILEILGGGLGEGLRRGDTHEGYLLAVQVKNLVGIQDIGALDAVLFMVEVAGDVGDDAVLGDSQGPLHAVVKLVVTKSG